MSSENSIETLVIEDTLIIENGNLILEKNNYYHRICINESSNQVVYIRATNVIPDMPALCTN